MLNAFIGTKINQSQTFTQDGKRIPVTNILSLPAVVIDIKTHQRDGYNAVKLGIGSRREITLTKPEIGVIRQAGIEKNLPRFLHEIPQDDIKTEEIKPGDYINIADVLKVGDSVSVTGVSKGKGFAGVVKRHHFKGGPRTHGQSDRERAPGSIGQTTTPGRVYKGKRMAGRMGNQKTTVKNLKVVTIDTEKQILTLSGLVPGGRNALVVVTKINNNKHG